MVSLPMQEKREASSTPGWGRSPGGRHGNPLSPAWRIPWTEEPGGLQSIGSHRLEHDLGCTHAGNLSHFPKTLTLTLVRSSILTLELGFKIIYFISHKKSLRHSFKESTFVYIFFLEMNKA